MIRQLKAELYKLLTVRSTYVLLGLVSLLVIAVNFWGVGYKFVGAVPPDFVQSAVVNSIIAVGVLSGVVGILLMTHEYRYNTIYYTLTLARSRTAVLLAKVLVMTSFAVVYTLLVALLTVAAVRLGLAAGDHTISAQVYDWSKILGNTLLYIWGICMLGLIFATIIRNQIGSIVLFLILPTTLEGIASIFLKQNVAYLPFNALGNLVMTQPGSFSVSKSAVIVLTWLALGLFVSWMLFTKRDAN